MLDMMRRTAGTWIVRILFAVLILSFAAWGIEDVFRRRGTPDNVAEVGGVAIARDDLSRQYRREIERLQRVMGPEFDSERAREMGLLERTLDTLIDGHLLGQKAADMGLVAGEELVRRQIFAEPAFQNSARVFDPQVFRRTLAENGLSEAVFVATLRGGIVRNQLTSAVIAGADAPTIMRDAIYRYRGEKRVAEYLKIPNTVIGAVPEPTQDELAAFHAQNPALFTTPELREVTAVYLDPDEAAKDFKPSEDQMRAAYEDRLAAISVPERRRLRHMLFATEADAVKAHEELAKGRPFDEVAKEASGQSAFDTNLGLVTQRDLTPVLAEAAFKLAEGKPSDPVKSPLGWHILLVDKIEPGKTPSFDDVRDEITRDLARELAVNSLVKTENQLEDELAGGAQLEAAAAKFGLKAIHVGPIDAKGRFKSGVPAPSLPQVPKFLETAFRVAPGQASQLQDVPGGGYFVLRVDGVTPPTLRPLDEVRSQVVDALKARRREDMARERAQALLDRAKGGAALGTIAAELRLEAKTSEPFTRFSVDPAAPVPPQLVAALFKASQGEAVMAPYEGGYAIGRLKEVQPAAPSDASQEVAKFNRELTASVAQDLVAEFTRALRRDYTVTIHRAALDSIQ